MRFKIKESGNEYEKEPKLKFYLLPIIEMSLKKILCFRQRNGKYIILSHDEESTKIVIDEIMEIVKICLFK